MIPTPSPVRSRIIDAPTHKPTTPQVRIRRGPRNCHIPTTTNLFTCQRANAPSMGELGIIHASDAVSTHPAGTIAADLHPSRKQTKRTVPLYVSPRISGAGRAFYLSFGLFLLRPSELLEQTASFKNNLIRAANPQVMSGTQRTKRLCSETAGMV